MLPEPDQIAELRHKDEIDRPVSDHLIRDRKITTARVVRLRRLHSRECDLSSSHLANALNLDIRGGTPLPRQCGPAAACTRTNEARPDPP